MASGIGSKAASRLRRTPLVGQQRRRTEGTELKISNKLPCGHSGNGLIEPLRNVRRQPGDLVLPMPEGAIGVDSGDPALGRRRFTSSKGSKPFVSSIR